MGAWGIAALALAIALTAGPASAQIGGCTPDLTGSVFVELETSLGTIPIELFPNTAPLTVQNFLNYVDDGDFDGTIVHRSVPGFVIQGGGFAEQAGAYADIPTDPPIVNEPCLSNTRGTVAMARLANQPDSATSQWFVNLEDNIPLDSTDGVGFTAFGRVVGDGMLVVDDIAARDLFDTLAYLTLPFNQIIRALPVQDLPVDPPGGYGCSRADPLFGLADETFDFFVEDPLRSGSVPGFVPILLDPVCDGSGATGPPSVSCTVGTGRDVFEIDLVAQTFIPTRIPMSCDAVAESETSWALRRAGTIAQLLAQDIEIVYAPEPGGALPLGAGVAALLALSRRRCSRS